MPQKNNSSLLCWNLNCYIINCSRCDLYLMIHFTFFYDLVRQQEYCIQCFARILAFIIKETSLSCNYCPTCETDVPCCCACEKTNETHVEASLDKIRHCTARNERNISFLTALYLHFTRTLQFCSADPKAQIWRLKLERNIQHPPLGPASFRTLSLVKFFLVSLL